MTAASTGAPDDTAAAPRSLASGFLRAAERFPDRPALELAKEVLSYAELRDRAAALAATLDAHTPAPAEEGDDGDDAAPALTAIFGARSITAYAGVLAGLLRGHGYVPLNPAFPIDRTRSMLARSGCRAVLVDAGATRQLGELLDGSAPHAVAAGLCLLLPEADAEEIARLAAAHPEHRFLGAAQLEPAGSWSGAALSKVDPSSIAYLLFTSGSTGQPKGVMVAHRNVTHFIDAMVERYGVTEEDRFSQTFDLTFDLSVFDMFVAWERGACLVAPTAAQKMMPAKYVRGCGLTIWFSVPSTAVMMSRLRMLKPGAFPGLRFSLFCGEALPVEVVQKWAAAAPASVLENLYGPTELTIACTLYRWDEATSPAESELGVCPIGDPYPQMRVLVANEALEEVAPGETGELLMTGPQLTLGYYRDPDRTAKAFVTPPGKDETYYRTGDRVRRPADGKPMVYLGRVDNQIKIQGYRVELGEIEAVVREESGVEVAIAIGWPQTASGADGVVAFIGADGADTAAIRERVNARLPPYMQPSEVLTVKEFPLNANGKVDRKALLETLQSER